MIKKRILAYIIDMIVITIISSFIYVLPIFEKEQSYYLEATNKYTETYKQYTENKKTEKDVLNAEYEMISTSSTLLIIRISVIIIYFSIIPYFKNGQTIGKKITSIKIVPNKGKKTNPGLYFLRGLLSSNVIMDITSILILIFASKTIYQNTALLISYITYFIYFLMIYIPLNRKDKRTLHDLITKTKVIDLKTIDNK